MGVERSTSAMSFSCSLLHKLVGASVLDSSVALKESYPTAQASMSIGGVSLMEADE
ncbi:hypothetical protein Bca4012_046385 [Brassica carinata]